MRTARNARKTKKWEVARQKFLDPKRQKPKNPNKKLKPFPAVLLPFPFFLTDSLLPRATISHPVYVCFTPLFILILHTVSHLLPRPACTLSVFFVCLFPLLLFLVDSSQQHNPTPARRFHPLILDFRELQQPATQYRKRHGTEPQKKLDKKKHEREIHKSCFLSFFSFFGDGGRKGRMANAWFCLADAAALSSPPPPERVKKRKKRKNWTLAANARQLTRRN